MNFAEWLEATENECRQGSLDEGILQRLAGPMVRTAAMGGLMAASGLGLIGGGNDARAAEPVARWNLPAGWSQSMSLHDIRPDPAGGKAYIYKFKGYTDEKKCAKEAEREVVTMIAKDNKGVAEGVMVGGVKRTQDGIIWVKVVHNPEFARRMSEPIKDPVRYLQQKYGTPSR
jgi:hypothetical protein